MKPQCVNLQQLQSIIDAIMNNATAFAKIQEKMLIYYFCDLVKFFRTDISFEKHNVFLDLF